MDAGDRKRSRRRRDRLTLAAGRAAAERAARSLGIDGYCSPGLGGGTQQRAGLACAPAPGPEIRFFGEPSPGFDPVTLRLPDDLILNMQWNAGASVIVVPDEPPGIFAITNASVVIDPDTGTHPAPGDPKLLLKECDDPIVHAFLTGGGHEQHI